MWYDIRIKVSKLLSSWTVHFFIINCPTLDNPLLTIASDIGIKTYIFIRHQTLGNMVLTMLSCNRSSAERRFNFLFIVSSSSSSMALTSFFALHFCDSTSRYFAFNDFSLAEHSSERATFYCATSLLNLAYLIKKCINRYIKKSVSGYGSFLECILFSCTVVIVQFYYLMFMVYWEFCWLKFRTGKFVRSNASFITFVCAIINGWMTFLWNSLCISIILSASFSTGTRWDNISFLIGSDFFNYFSWPVKTFQMNWPISSSICNMELMICEMAAKSFTLDWRSERAFVTQRTSSKNVIWKTICISNRVFQWTKRSGFPFFETMSSRASVIITYCSWHLQQAAPCDNHHMTSALTRFKALRP